MTPFESFPGAAQRWQNFYMLSGGAAATLTGLMFVAVTFGSGLVRKETMQSARAFLDPTFMHFAQVLVTGCAMTIPNLDPGILGATLAAVGGCRLVGLVWVYAQYQEAQRRNADLALSDWLSGIVAPAACHALTLLAGVGFFLRRAEAFTGLAVATIGTLATALYGAWEMMVWMAVAVAERRGDTPGARDAEPPT